MNIQGTSHRIRDLDLKSLSIKEVREYSQRDGEEIRTFRLSAKVAYVRDDGHTCGKLTVQNALLSHDTKSIIVALIRAIEEDAARAVFDIGGTEPTEPL